MRTWFTRFLTAGAVAIVLAGAVISAPAAAQDKPVAEVPTPVVAAVAFESATVAPTATVPTTAPVTAAAPAAIAPVATAPVPNKGGVTWLLVFIASVILMTLLSLTLFYGGLVCKRSMLSALMQCMGIFSLIIILRAVYGYSFAFIEGSTSFGGLNRLFLKGLTPNSVAVTFSKDMVVPEYVCLTSQGTFAAITCALIIGASAERAKFSIVLLSVALWFTLGYVSTAHMVWFWPGPDGFIGTEAAEMMMARPGWLFQKDTPDFAGGTVVHINAAVAGLVSALLLGKRIGPGRKAPEPHNLTLTAVDTLLLWFGWLGFNADSALEADGSATLVSINVLLATVAVVLSWSFGEWFGKNKPPMLGAASGATTSLVAITPTTDLIGPMDLITLGITAGLLCLWDVNDLKRMLDIDDTLDVSSTHGMSGILDTLLTGVFAALSPGGTGIYDYIVNKITDDYSISG